MARALVSDLRYYCIKEEKLSTLFSVVDVVIKTDLMAAWLH